jgi:hypothetical protein
VATFHSVGLVSVWSSSLIPRADFAEMLDELAFLREQSGSAADPRRGIQHRAESTLRVLAAIGAVALRWDGEERQRRGLHFWALAGRRRHGNLSPPHRCNTARWARPSREFLNALKIGNPADWFLRHYENQAALEIVFVTFEDDIPHLLLRYFVAHSDKITGTVSVEIKRSDSPSAEFPGSIIVLLGRHEAVVGELSRNPTIWEELGLPGAVRHLIEIEMAAFPDEVGAPIAIAEITKHGPHWVRQCDPH